MARQSRTETPESLLRAVLRDCNKNERQWRQYNHWLAEQEPHPVGPEVIAGTDDAILASIIEQPDDDLPRLAYADRLAENGDPDRAEFVQAQIGLHRAERGDPRIPELDSRHRA